MSGAGVMALSRALQRVQRVTVVVGSVVFVGLCGFVCVRNSEVIATQLGADVPKLEALIVANK